MTVKKVLDRISRIKLGDTFEYNDARWVKVKPYIGKYGCHGKAERLSDRLGMHFSKFETITKVRRKRKKS